MSLEAPWTVAATDNSIDAGLVERALGEYREMPGLALTIDQVIRRGGCGGARDG